MYHKCLNFLFSHHFLSANAINNSMFLSKRLTFCVRYFDHFSLTKTIVNKMIFVIIKKVHFFKSLGSVVELVDAPHSKCGTFGYVGSSPTAPTLMDTYSRFDISFKKGKGCWLWDKTGKKYLDAVAGIATCSLGHSDRVLRRRLSSQLKKIQHISNLYLSLIHI